MSGTCLLVRNANAATNGIKCWESSSLLPIQQQMTYSSSRLLGRHISDWNCFRPWATFLCRFCKHWRAFLNYFKEWVEDISSKNMYHLSLSNIHQRIFLSNIHILARNQVWLLIIWHGTGYLEALPIELLGIFFWTLQVSLGPSEPNDLYPTPFLPWIWGWSKINFLAAHLT